MIKLLIPQPLSAASVFGHVSHGSADLEYEDDAIKQLLGRNAGAYGRHWVYGTRKVLGRPGEAMHEGNILVTYGYGNEEHITFVGRTGLNECLEFLAQFEPK